MLLNYWDFLAVLLLILVSLPVTWLSPRSIVSVPYAGMFDDHWVLDSMFKASRGIWFGRDVAFPYGPLFQWLFSAPSRWAGLSFSAIHTSYLTLLLWCTFLFGYFTLRLLLPEQPNWKRFLLLVLLCVFWAPWDGRTAFAIFLFALFLRSWYGVRQGIVRPVVMGCSAALLCTIAFLYSADTGVYGIAALLLSLAGVAWEGQRERKVFPRYLTALLAFAGSFVVLVFAVNVLMGSVLDFRFWRSSLALVSIHRWNEPSAMSQPEATRLLGALAAGTIVFLLRHFVPDKHASSLAARSGFLIGAFVFALAMMQSGLVRSDSMHVVFAVFPMVFFTGVVLFSFGSRLASAIAAVVAVGGCAVGAQPERAFTPSSLRYKVAQLRHPSRECPAGFEDFRQICYPAHFVNMLNVADNYLDQHTPPNDSILIFPYQYMFGITSDRNVAGGVLQSFLANGSYLSQLDIAGMAKAAAPAGLYFPDGELSLRIDDVSNFTRTPDIWFWIFNHYEAGPALFPGVVSLQRQDSRTTHISTQSTPIGLLPQTHPIEQRSAVVNLGAPSWPADADFLRLRMTVHYGILWKLLKPERLQLEITRADGSRDLRTFVIEPNLSSEVWFYPWDERELARYFDSDESRWRTALRSPITQLRLLTSPFDSISQQPDAVSIKAADAISLRTAH
ncbi:MAG: hypothetical protein WA655_14580 [Candidatus Korobacteraceae bacterium]